MIGKPFQLAVFGEQVIGAEFVLAHSVELPAFLTEVVLLFVGLYLDDVLRQ